MFVTRTKKEKPTPEERESRKLRPTGQLCPICFCPVYDHQPYVWSKQRNGGITFVHRAHLGGGGQ